MPTGGFLILIKVPPDGRPVKANFDRPITAEEYTVVYPGVVKVVGRMTDVRPLIDLRRVC
ncbi:MAG: hypothetical protein HA494_06095 [Thaumarchaeota archaeon]|nr:hypothetical protein [Nitrososphaerota archaeon]